MLTKKNHYQPRPQLQKGIKVASFYYLAKLNALALPIRKTLTIPWVQAFCASVCLVISAQVSIPFYPVHMTLHTFVLMLMGLCLPVSTAVNAVFLYLGYTAMGIPVLQGGVGGMATLMGPTAGYIFGFVPMAGVIAWLMHRYPSAGVFMRYGFVLLGSLCVFVPGVGYLAHLFGWGTALKLGLFPFVLSDLTKIIFAVSLSKVIGNKLLQRKH